MTESPEPTGSVEQWNRVSALEEIENLKNIRATAWDEHTHSFRWIMATLLAVNGGACLAILNHDAIHTTFRLVASGLFIGGLLMALLVAVFGQHSVQKSLGPLQKQIGYWMTVAADGEREEKFESDLNDELKVSARIGMWGRMAGWAAVLCFILGVVIAGYGIAAADNSGSNQIDRQHEMMQSNDR